MNIFRFLGDLSHIVSFIILLHKIVKGKSVAGLSLRTQELYMCVFCFRYIDLLWNFSSMYNWFLKILFIGASGAIECVGLRAAVYGRKRDRRPLFARCSLSRDVPRRRVARARSGGRAGGGAKLST